MPTVNLGRVKPIWRGAHNVAVAYKALDFVSSNGTAFICIAPTTAGNAAHAPPNAAFWAPLNNVGAALEQIPSNQLLADGVTRGSAGGGLTAIYSRRYSTGVGTGAGSGMYFLLAQQNSAGAAYFSGSFTCHSGDTSNGVLGTGNLLIQKSPAGGVRALFDYQGRAIGGTTPAPRLVTVDYLGASYLALRFLGNSRRPTDFYLTGVVAGLANLTLIGATDGQVSNEQPLVVSNEVDVVAGRPGDAAGANAVLFSGQSGYGTAVDAGRIETGTWTPSIVGTSAPGTHTYSSQLGSYIKRGPLVQLSFDVVTSAIDGGWAGNAVIAGLPFAVNTPAGATQGATLIPHCQGITLPATPYGLSANPSASALILQTSAGSPVGAPAALAVSAFTAGVNRLRGTLTYRAANG